MRTGLSLLQTLALRPLLCDGAMGTLLIERGLPAGAGSELWTLENPDEVRAVHLAYLGAGCDMLTTNTFGGCRLNLERQGAGLDAFELNEAAARLAREVAGDAAWVLGGMGPYGGFLEPAGDGDPVLVQEAFMEQAQALEAGGADAILVETMSDPAEARLAIEGARGGTGLPVLATFAFDAGTPYRTMMGASVGQGVGTAIEAGASVVGVNCGKGMSLEDYALLAPQVVHAARGVPVIVQPNAGAPQMVGGRLAYTATPDQMAALVPRLLHAGVRIVGGCCGTSPAHLAAMRAGIA
jgi:5-methyltetrahydrofolate--homocysteine methyltransferase